MAFLDRGLHQVYYETYGNPDGTPVMFLHGGPGVNISDADKRFFDPDKHFAILFDQRGCGQSLPKAEITENTTQNLMSDMNALLDLFQIDQVILFGGSWGATLALTYAIHFPLRVKAMVLRGTFMADDESMSIFLGGALGKRYPEAWSRMLALVPNAFRHRIAQYYHEQIFSEDPHRQDQFAFEWLLFGASTIYKTYDINRSKSYVESVDYVAKGKIQIHYVVNDFFLSNDFILKNTKNISQIPTWFVHGRHDHLCPLHIVEKLCDKMKKASLTIVDAGHAPTETELEKEMIKALGKATSK